MIDISDLINIADEYKAAAGIERDSTVAHRVFGDSKKLTLLRSGAQLTVSRFNHAILWFSTNWPAGRKRPVKLMILIGEEDAA